MALLCWDGCRSGSSLSHQGEDQEDGEQRPAHPCECKDGTEDLALLAGGAPVDSGNDRVL